jgi:hypothetical protein
MTSAIRVPRGIAALALPPLDTVLAWLVGIPGTQGTAVVPWPVRRAVGAGRATCL